MVLSKRYTPLNHIIFWFAVVEGKLISPLNHFLWFYEGFGVI